MPLDHISIGVADVRKAKAFYDKALAPLGWKAVMPVEVQGMLVGVGYGDTGFPTFWIQAPLNRDKASAGNGTHIAFSAATRNSLVVLPLALAVPGAVPVLPAVIVAQTLVELISELICVRAVPRLGKEITPA